MIDSMSGKQRPLKVIPRNNRTPRRKQTTPWICETIFSVDNLNAIILLQNPNNVVNNKEFLRKKMTELQKWTSIKDEKKEMFYRSYA